MALGQDAQPGSPAVESADPAGFGRHQLSWAQGSSLHCAPQPVLTAGPWPPSSLSTAVMGPVAVEADVDRLQCIVLLPSALPESSPRRTFALVPCRLEMEFAELGTEVPLLTSAECKFLP